MVDKQAKQQISRHYQALVFALFSVLGLFALAYSTGIGPVSPSDPVQYHNGAFSDTGGFPYLDRLTLLVSLRLFALFVPVDAYLAPIMTLSYVLGTASIAGFWLYHRFSSGAACLFMVIFASAPAWMSIASYSYPMQCLSFFLVLYLIAADRFDDSHWRYVILGLISVFILFSKVQGAAILLITFADIIMRREQWFMNMVRYGIGGIAGLAILLSLLFLLLGVNDTISMFEEALFGHTLSGQIKGRGEGGIPPYFVYLFQPHYWLAFVGLILPFFVSAAPTQARSTFVARQISFVGLGQFAFLMLIYLLTWRGGPPISNYILDSFTCGVISFAIMVGAQKPFKVLTFHHALIVVLGAIIALMLTGYAIQNTHLFLQNYQSLGPDFFYFICVGICFAGLSCIWVLSHFCRHYLPAFLSLKITSFPRAILGGILLLFALSCSLGVREAAFRHDYAARHHEAAKQIAEQILQDDNNKVVSIKDISDGDLPDLGYGIADARHRISMLLPLYQ